jgi:hypothetical protein
MFWVVLCSKWKKHCIAAMTTCAGRRVLVAVILFAVAWWQCCYAGHEVLHGYRLAPGDLKAEEIAIAQVNCDFCVLLLWFLC